MAGSFFGKDTKLEDVEYHEEYRFDFIKTCPESQSALAASPSPNGITKYTKPSSTSKMTTTEQIKETLQLTKEWQQVCKLFESDDFTDIPDQLTINFAKSFLLQGAKHLSATTEFAIALARIVEFISPSKIPVALLPPYVTFFKDFQPTEEH
jgi:hypothetical protein